MLEVGGTFLDLPSSFFCQGFPLQTLAIDRTAVEVRGFLYHLLPLTNIRLFATLQMRRISRIFMRIYCNYQTSTRRDFPLYWIWSIDDGMLNSFCFLDDLFLAFYYSSLTEEISRLELSSTITTVLRANRLTKCAIHPLLMYEFTFVCWYRTSYIVDIAVCMTSILEQRNCYNDDDILVLNQHDTLPWNKGSLYFSNSTISSSAWNLKYLSDGTIKFCGLLLFLEYSITIDYWRVAILEDSRLEGTTRQR